MEKIEELLGEELWTKVAEKLGDHKLILNDGQFIPKSRLEQETEKVKLLRTDKEQLAKEVSEKEEALTVVQKQVEEFKAKTPNADELKKQIADLQSKVKETETESGKLQSEYDRKVQIMNALHEQQAKPKYVQFLIEQLGGVKWSNDGKSLEGLDEALPKLKESFVEMFGEVQRQGTGSGNNGGKNEGKPGEFYTEEELAAVLAGPMEVRLKNIDKINASMKLLASPQK